MVVIYNFICPCNFPIFQCYQTPWKSIFTSLPVWAIIVGHFANNWGFYTILTNIPTYFKDILGVNIREVIYYILSVFHCTC